MGLQKHAQVEVEQKIKELWEAYKYGYNTGVLGERAMVEEVDPDKYDFKFFLEGSHPLLAEYFDLEKPL